MVGPLSESKISGGGFFIGLYRTINKNIYTFKQ
jgi:hypothetical protein